MIRGLALLLLLASPATAEVARVYSGEHDDFTRLVIELPVAADWSLGRTAMGYAFASAGAKQPDFDISTVWDRIPKSRLQALRSDPETGALQLTLACACHIFPFEYQPGIIVLDIKPGKAPPGSSFEQAFAFPQGEAPNLKPESSTSSAYNWLELKADAQPSDQPAFELALPSGEVSLEPLRLELLAEISRGAAQGVVDMKLPGKPPTVQTVDPGGFPWSQIHIGPPPDIKLGAPESDTASRTAEGQACIPNDSLSLADWGENHPPQELLAEARSGLYGEFDQLDRKAALLAVRRHLYLGFGAEAAQYARLLDETGTSEETAVLQSLALLVDGNRDPQSPFLAMLNCDGPAALWSALAQTDFPAGAAVNGDAIARSFLALPSHLRGALGPGLAEQLLDNGQVKAAGIIRNAVERTPDVPHSSVALLDAKVDLQGGQPDAALDHAAEAVAEDGSNVEEWMALVEAHFRKIRPMAPEAAAALRAFETEMEASENMKNYFRSLALAEMLSGQTDAGFRVADVHGLPMSDLWQVAATMARDDDFLRHAVPSVPEFIAPEVAITVAERLVRLGFPDAGLAWLGLVDPKDGLDRRRIAAQAEFARGDAGRVLVLLEGPVTPEDHTLRARSMLQLGHIPEARKEFQAAGLEEEALRLAAWQGAWPELQAAETPLWADASIDPAADLPSDAGPLARTAAILEASASSREAISALLSGIDDPNP